MEKKNWSERVTLSTAPSGTPDSAGQVWTHIVVVDVLLVVFVVVVVVVALASALVAVLASTLVAVLAGGDGVVAVAVPGRDATGVNLELPKKDGLVVP